MLTWEQLGVFNSEFIALVRAGIPLDLGFRRLGRDIPGQLGRAMHMVGERLESGADLDQALSHSSDLFPPVYCAVVQAGLKSGRLVVALEGLSTTVRRVAETRRGMLVALIYPWIVFSVASAVLFLSTHTIVTAVRESFRSFRIAEPAWFEWLSRGSVPLVGLVVGSWFLVTLILVAWYFRSRQVSRHAVSSSRSSLSRMFYLSRLAEATDLLALLIERQLPLDQALPLAFATTGDAELEQAACEMVRKIQGGSVPHALGQGGSGELEERAGSDLWAGSAGMYSQKAAVSPASFPPWLGWLLECQPDGDGAVRALRMAAASYRRQAQRLGRWLGIYLPILLAAGVGGFLVLSYAIIVFFPLYQLLYRLSVIATCTG